MKKHTKNGYSIIEGLVAMAIFIIVVTVAVDAFSSALKAQRIVSAEETMAGSVNFAMEFMNRQLRTAVPSTDTSCVNPLGDTFKGVPSSRITFFNDDGNCIEFRRQGQRLIYTPDVLAPVPEDIELISNNFIRINNFNIFVQGEEAYGGICPGPPGDCLQPRVTLVIEASWWDPSNSKAPNVDLILQTTVSTRLLDK